MGTTLVAALINEKSDSVIASVGDSRAYLVGTDARQVTKDHTFVEEMVERGLITRDAARVHPERNVVTRIIGLDPVLPDLVEIHLGDNTLLLCTDGFSDLFTEQELGLEFRNPDVTSICDNLIKRAKEADGDNTTVVVARKAQ
jgi:protein phosphatase